MLNKTSVHTEANDHALEEKIQELDRLAYYLDSSLRIPGTDIRYGWDSLIGLIPGLGDTVMALPSLFVIWRAYRLGVTKGALIRMGINVGIDMVVGSIPLIGDIFDIGFKVNLKNVALARRNLMKHA